MTLLTYKVELSNKTTNEKYLLCIVDKSMFGALRTAKDHAMFTKGWRFEEIKLELILPTQEHEKEIVEKYYLHDEVKVIAYDRI